MAFKYFNVKNGLTTGNIELHASNGNVQASTFLGNINVTSSANLGNVSNLVITGGSAEYVLSTDGAGNLSWVPQAGSSGNLEAFSDTFTGNGVQTTFELSTAPSNINLVTVNYNGEILLRDSYSIDGANIVFTEPPANTAEIEVTTLAGGGGGGGGGTPGGSNTQVQFNDAGSFGGNSGFTFNKTTTTLTANNFVVTSTANLGNLATANYFQGTLTTASQPNITSVGTLGSLAVTGNITSGNISTGSANLTGNITLTGGINDTGGNFYTIGYREVPQVAKSANYTLENYDNGKHVYYTGTGSTLTIPADGSTTGGNFPIGTVLTVVNNSSGNVNINTSVTLNHAGTANTGNRIIATKGLATIMKVASNTWFISGVGIT